MFNSSEYEYERDALLKVLRWRDLLSESNAALAYFTAVSEMVICFDLLLRDLTSQKNKNTHQIYSIIQFFLIANTKHKQEHKICQKRSQHKLF